VVPLTRHRRRAPGARRQRRGEPGELSESREQRRCWGGGDKKSKSVNNAWMLGFTEQMEESENWRGISCWILDGGCGIRVDFADV